MMVASIHYSFSEDFANRSVIADALVSSLLAHSSFYHMMLPQRDLRRSSAVQSTGDQDLQDCCRKKSAESSVVVVG